MRWTRDSFSESAGALQRLGLKTCTICASEQLEVDDRPVQLLVGGSEQRRDEQTNVVYLLRVECAGCGLTMTFSAERYRDGDTPILRVP